MSNEFNGILVTSGLSYFAVVIHKKKQCFSLQGEECLNKARKYANLFCDCQKLHYTEDKRNILEKCSITCNSTWT